jgi:signal transduction histidine kinase/CheY-like chemotaxis protein
MPGDDGLTERRLSKPEQRNALLLELHDLAARLPEAEIYKFALQKAVDLTGSRVGYLHTVHADQENLSLTVWSDETLRQCTAAYDSHYPLSAAGIWADSVRTRRPAVHNDYPNEPARHGYPAGHFPIIRHVSVPVVSGGLVCMVIGVGNKATPYDDADVSELQVVAAEIAKVVDRKNLETQLHNAQKLEAVGKLAGGVAHEFNNLLSAVLGYASLLRQPSLDLERARLYGAEIQRLAEHGAEVTAGLLAFSQRHERPMAPLEVNAMLRQFKTGLSQLVREDIRFEIVFGSLPLWVEADAGQLQQVFLNLVLNAGDAMPRGGALHISVRPATPADIMRMNVAPHPGGYALVSITDTGDGIVPEVRDRIFEPFFTTKGVGRGSGLGLSVVYGILQSHGGVIDVDSTPGGGTEIRLFLPLLPHQPAAAEHAMAPPAAAAPAPRPGGKILLVEDNDAVRLVTRYVLEHAGYGVIEAVDGDDAVAQFRAHRPELALVVSDLVMPKRSGWEFYETVDGPASGVKFIFLSGYSRELLQDKGISEKDITLLAKPLSPDELLAWIAKEMAAAGAA